MDSLIIIQKSLKNHSIFRTDIAVAIDHTALRVSVMQWRLEVILSTVHHNECSYGFWDSHQLINRKFHEIND